MLLFIEDYPYKLDTIIRDGQSIRYILKDLVSFPQKEEIASFGYVGYVYSKAAKDVVFFLPKVVLTGEQDETNEADTIFGASPQSIIDFDNEAIKSRFTEQQGKDYKEFLSTLAIWIYRTIAVYKETNNDNILESKEHQTESRGKKQKHNTLLDVIIALRDFNRNNQDYFTFISKNLHSGYEKIHWSKTISQTQAIIQKGVPVYTNPIIKRKVLNFDEELLVIYFSILKYISQTHGFTFDINLNYNLISCSKLKSLYINKKMGCRKLNQIKYKYFSDKALRIWDLCYAFFDREYEIAMNHHAEDYLLAKNFEHIFEVMIDDLISDKKHRQLPEELSKQKDGKLVDHIFIGNGLIEQSDIPAELTYYIGDSKYYKRLQNDRTQISEKSVYKQYTYARNVIQWNMNLFLGLDNKSDYEVQPVLRDELTEGYNPIPNFFISARIPYKSDDEKQKYLSFDESALQAQPNGVKLNRQFENRLFDRDTLLLCHYDVNFLYIVSLYSRQNKNKQSAWRSYVRNEFRTKIQSTLNDLYEFRTLQPKAGKDCYHFIKENFHQLNGKLYRPHTDSNYLVLALMKSESAVVKRLSGSKTHSELQKNRDVVASLQSHFYVSEPFELTAQMSIDSISDVGTLERIDVALPENQKMFEEKVLIFVEIHNSTWDNIEKYNFIAISLDMVKEAFTAVQEFSEAKYILLTNRGSGDKAKNRVYQIDEKPQVVPSVSEEQTLARHYHELAKPSMTPEEYEATKGKPAIHLLFQLGDVVSDNMMSVDREKVERTKSENEDVRSPRMSIIKDIIVDCV